jgi:hypothetical protein
MVTMTVSIKSEFFTPVGVQLAHHKNQRHHGDKNQISHKFQFHLVPPDDWGLDRS